MLAAGLRARRAAAAALLSIFLLGFAGPVRSESGRSIGLAGPRDGIYASQTAAIRDGVAAAVAILNAAPGAHAAKFKIIEADDGCDADRAEQAARDFAAKGVAIVIGHPCQSAAVAAARVYAQSGIAFVALATFVPELTEPRIGAGIFRLSAREDDQARDTAAYIASRWPAVPIFLVHDRTRYGSGLAKGVEAELVSRERPAPAVAEIVAGELAYPRLAEAVARIKAGVVYFAGFPAEARLIRRALDRAGLADVALVLSDAAGVSAPEVGAKGQSPIVTMRMRKGLPGENAALPEALSRLAEHAFELWHSGALTSTSGAGHEKIFDANGDVNWPSFEALEWDGANWQAVRSDPAARSLTKP